ncbi:MAG: hypothetical protein QOI61_2532 [Actinomycetota bacterium]
MTLSRRIVRATDGFFIQLDSQLPSTRGADGTPSAGDFLVLELPAIVDLFATNFEALPEVAVGMGSARVSINKSLIVDSFAVYGVLLTDDSIELIGVDIELWRTPSP